MSFDSVDQEAPWLAFAFDFTFATLPEPGLNFCTGTDVLCPLIDLRLKTSESAKRHVLAGWSSNGPIGGHATVKSSHSSNEQNICTTCANLEIFKFSTRQIFPEDLTGGRFSRPWPQRAGPPFKPTDIRIETIVLIFDIDTNISLIDIHNLDVYII